MALDIALIGRGSAANDGTGDSARDGALKINKNTRLLEALAKGGVISATTTAQPASPSVGDLYIIPSGKTGAVWSSYANDSLALYAESDGANAWFEITPTEGMRLFARDTDLFYRYTGSAWATDFGAVIKTKATGSTEERSLADRFAERYSVQDFGAVVDGTTDDASAVQAAMDYIESVGGGELLLPRGVCVCSSLTPRNRVVVVGQGKGVSILRCKNGVNDDFIKTEGFDSFADDVSRSYAWHSSTTARNAQSYSSGQYVMVASAATDFNNATWWLATATPADADNEWQEVDPVVGCVAGGFRNLTIDANAAGQAGDHIGAALYGVNMVLDNVSFEDAGTPLHCESPGGVYSNQVGENLQWTVQSIEVRQFTVDGFVNNIQSDTVVDDVQVYCADDVTPSGQMVHFKSKSAGQKWNGAHVWGGEAGSIGVKIDAGTVSLTNADIERIVVLGEAGEAFRFEGQVYRSTNATAETSAAFDIAAGLDGVYISVGIRHFRYSIKVAATAGLACFYDVSHYSEHATPNFLDPAGATSLAPTTTSAVNWDYRPYYANGVAQTNYNHLNAVRFRRRRQGISYAASITPNHAAGDYIEVGQLTGSITINAPTNAQEGDEIQFMFQQDTVGGRAITWNSVFVGGPTASGTSFQRRACRFVFDGVRWILCGDTGAWV